MKRVNQALSTSDSNFRYGLLDIANFLFYDLENFLIQEDRYKGITIRIIERTRDIYEDLNEIDTSEDLEVYSRILYLLKPTILYEYEKLKERGVSKADCTIVLIKKILDIVLEDQELQKRDLVLELSGMINKLFDNIRNKGKYYSLFKLSESIRIGLESGLLGKYVVPSFSLIQEEQRVRPKELMKEESKEIFNQSTSELKNINL